MSEQNADNYLVTALVVTYNRKPLLLECLRAIADQQYPVMSIVVIDNASTDGTDELFAEGGLLSESDIIEYHRMGSNLGGAGGFKEGLRIASQSGADWVWLMDDDCIPYPDTLAQLVRAVRRAKECNPTTSTSFVASSVFGPQGEPMNVPAVDTRPTRNGYADWYAELTDGMVEIESATFVSLLVNCEAIRSVGLPVGAFFIWGDDAEYTTRLTHNFGPAYLVGPSRVLHKRANAKNLDIMREEDPRRISNYHYLYRNNLIVQRYHHGRVAAAKLLLCDLDAAMRCLASGDGGSTARRARSAAILTGVAEYLGGRYDLEDLGRLVRRGGAGAG